MESTAKRFRVWVKENKKRNEKRVKESKKESLYSDADIRKVCNILYAKKI